jgi:hypothetical protein
MAAQGSTRRHYVARFGGCGANGCGRCRCKVKRQEEWMDGRDGEEKGAPYEEQRV